MVEKFLYVYFFVVISILELPLCASGASKKECTSGFVSLDTLRNLATPINILPFQDSPQTIFPSIGFTCGGSITGWTALVVQKTGANTGFPDLQVWRKTGKDTFTKVSNITLRGGGNEVTFIYDYVVDPPLQFLPGDVLGLFEHSNNHLRIDFQATDSAPEFYRVTDASPLLQVVNTNSSNVKISSRYQPFIDVTTDQPECSKGFFSREKMQLILENINGAGHVIQDGTQSISPHTNFTCDGNITKWIFAASQNRNYDLYPELQIWRQGNNKSSNGSVSDYYKVWGTRVSAETSSHSRVYEHSVNPPLPFLAGDILGVYSSTCVGTLCGNLRVIHEINSDNPTFYQHADDNPQDDFPVPGLTVWSHHHRPLVTVEIETTHTIDCPDQSTSLFVNTQPKSSSMQQAMSTVTSSTSYATTILTTQMPSKTLVPIPSVPIGGITPDDNSVPTALLIVIVLIGGIIVLIALPTIFIVVVVCLSKARNQARVRREANVTVANPATGTTAAHTTSESDIESERTLQPQKVDVEAYLEECDLS